MIDQDRLALDLYAAVLDGTDLSEPLAGIADLLGAEAGFITRVAFNSELILPERFVQHGYDPASMVEYQEHWIRYDPWMSVGRDQPPGVLNFGRLVPSETVARTAFWNEFAAKQQVQAFHSLAASFALSGEATGVLAVQRRKASEPFGPVEESLLSTMYPHIRRALAAEVRLVSASVQAQAAEAVLETQDLGIAVFQLNGRLAYANATMRSITSKHDGISLSERGLAATEQLANGLVEEALRHGLAVAAGKIAARGDIGSIVVSRPSGGTPWLVQVLPMRPGGRGPLTSIAGVVMLIADPDSRAGPNEKNLQQLLGLTPSESALSVALAEGKTLAAHARRHRTSVETMRTHLANIRRKTGCRRQAELVALIMRLSR